MHCKKSREKNLSFSRKWGFFFLKMSIFFLKTANNSPFWEKNPHFEKKSSFSRKGQICYHYFLPCGTHCLLTCTYIYEVCYVALVLILKCGILLHYNHYNMFSVYHTSVFFYRPFLWSGHLYTMHVLLMLFYFFSSQAVFLLFAYK